MIDNIIRGSCTLYACRCCRTKFGWRHQSWCDLFTVTEPTCRECRYYNAEKNDCAHPAQKREGRGLPYEEDQGTL